MANACWCKGAVLAELFGIPEHDCCHPRKKNSILCKACLEAIPADKLHTVAVNMACDEQLMATLNRIDGECQDIRAYQGRLNEIKSNMLDVFDRVHQEMEDRSVRPERIERSRSPRIHQNRASLVQAIIQLDNADFGWVAQQIGNETARRFQL